MFRTDGIKKFVFLSFCVVFAMALNFLESLIPLGSMIPGIKIGVSNIVILAVIYLYSVKEGVICAFLKSTLSLFLFSNMSAFIYSLCGAIISAFMMGMLKKVKCFTSVGVSVWGSFFHITTQIVISAITLGSGTVFYYYPYLLLFSIISGFVNGYLVKILLEILERRV